MLSKRYWLFGFETHEPQGGLKDLIAVSDDISSLIQPIKESDSCLYWGPNNEQANVLYVFDADARKIVWAKIDSCTSYHIEGLDQLDITVL